MPSIVPEGASRGWVIPIGGAESMENDRHILERFVRCAGGWEAGIVVIPTASRLHETGPRYEKLFKDIGAARVARRARSGCTCARGSRRRKVHTSG